MTPPTQEEKRDERKLETAVNYPESDFQVSPATQCINDLFCSPPSAATDAVGELERDCQQETVADVARRPSASSRHSTSGHDPPRHATRLAASAPRGAAKHDPTYVSNPRSEILQKHSTQPTNSDKNSTKSNALTDRAFRRLHPAATGGKREWAIVSAACLRARAIRY